MAEQWEWSNDTVPIEDESLRQLSPDLDPYTKWLAKFGSDFRFTESEPVENPEDYSFLGLIEDMLQDPDRSAPLSFPKSLDPVGHVDALFARIAESPDDIVPATQGNKRAARQDLLWVMSQARLVYSLPMQRRCFPETDFVRDSGPTSPQLDVVSQGVENIAIVACIDDGINPIHERFCADGAPRMDFFWLQDGTHNNAGDLNFGREFTRTELQAAMASHPNDEEGALRELGLIDFEAVQANQIARRVTHGTHVLDTAAGGMGAEVRLIGVQLPAMVTAETSGVLISYFFLRAFEYVLKRAILIKNALGERGNGVPIFTNFSYGFSAGAHDGQQLVEVGISRLIEKYRAELGESDVKVVFPSGNRQLKRGHGVARALAGGGDTSLDLQWRIHPADSTPNYVEAWIPSTDGKDIAIAIEGPGGIHVLQATDLLEQPRILAIRNGEDVVRNSVLARVSVDKPPHYDPSETVQERQLWPLLIVMAPSGPTNTNRSPLPSGIWKISITGALEENEAIHAWVPRDEAPLGYRRQGYQSYFDEPEYVRFTPEGDVLDVDDPKSPFIRRAGTISGMAVSGPHIKVVGAYEGRQGEERPTPYSATAVEPDRFRPETAVPGPDFSARSDTSRVLRGILGAGARSGSVVALNGTSVAAPQLVRMLVDALAPGGRSLPQCVKPSGSGKPVERGREGTGRLETPPALKFQVERDRIG